MVPHDRGQGTFDQRRRGSAVALRQVEQRQARLGKRTKLVGLTVGVGRIRQVADSAANFADLVACQPGVAQVARRALAQRRSRFALPVDPPAPRG